MLPDGWGGATADYTIKLLAPAGGERLVARGRLIQFGRTLSVAAAEVFSVRDGRETLCATALITARTFPKAGT
jgi:acyl-coenzyme A thioesterase PaaI-like protein